MLFGVATAATQIEGGEQNTNWYRWYKNGRVSGSVGPDVATMHWERWREDAALMRDMGLQVCRLGLEWARIEPERGVFDEAVLARYREELSLLREYGIAPMVTLWHFSNPLWFEDRGGFLAPDAAVSYLIYVEKVVAALGDLVESWCTLNEPNVYAVNGYFKGAWPPGAISLGSALRVMNAFVPCHIGAYKYIHSVYPAAKVGLALHVRAFDPKNRKNPVDKLSAWVLARCFQTAPMRALQTGRRALPMKRTAPGKYYDYIGLNYYTRSACTVRGDGVMDDVPKSDLGWEIYPEGLARCVKVAASKYGGPVYITENGVCDEDDSFRCRYIYEHLKALEGLPAVERYYHWCFCDNWEWVEAETARFGLVHVDYETQERQMKKSGLFYRDVIRAGGVNDALYEKYVKEETYPSR